MSSLIDIKAFHVQPDGQVVQALADETTSGETVDSTEKLLQKFWIIFMEQRGSVPYLSTQGTRFLNRFLAGTFVDETDVFANFAAATIDVAPQLRNSTTVNDPPDEKYVKAVLEQVFISTDEITLQVRVNNQSGQGQSFLLPLQSQVR